MPECAYIHIPFCRRKCGYCAFVSYNRPELQGIYVEKLIQEIKTKYKGENLKTIYFGGGTPSLLEISQIENILKSEFVNVMPVHLARELLAGFEMNFGSVSSEEPAPAPQPEPQKQPQPAPQPAAQGGDGMVMSQDEIEKMLNNLVDQPPVQDQPVQTQPAQQPPQAPGGTDHYDTHENASPPC